MNKIEYLLRRFATEYSNWKNASYWEVELIKYGTVWYFYSRLLRKGLAPADLMGIQFAAEKTESGRIHSGDEVDCEIKKLVAIIRLGKKGQAK